MPLGTRLLFPQAALFPFCSHVPDSSETPVAGLLPPPLPPPTRYSTLIHFFLPLVCPGRIPNSFRTNSSASIPTELARCAFLRGWLSYRLCVARLKREVGRPCALLGRRRKKL